MDRCEKAADGSTTIAFLRIKSLILSKCQMIQNSKIPSKYIDKISLEKSEVKSFIIKFYFFCFIKEQETFHQLHRIKRKENYQSENELRAQVRKVFPRSKVRKFKKLLFNFTLK